MAMLRNVLLFLLGLMLPVAGSTQIHSHRVTRSFSTPFGSSYDLAWDGKDLWLSHGKGRIARIDPSTGRVIGRVDTRMGKLKGLAHDGKALWAAETEKGKIHRIDPSNGRSTEEHPTPAEGLTRPSGLAWDGKMLWNNDTRTIYCGTGKEDASYRFDPENGVQKKFDGVRDCPFGLAFGAGHLWVGENSDHRIYMVDTSNGKVIDSIKAPGEYVNGLAFADGALWVASNGDEEADLHRIDMELKGEKGYVSADSKGDFFYPNPAEDHIRIELPKEVPSGQKRVELYGPNGKRILIRSLEGRNDRLSLPELPSGIHHLRVLNEGKVWRSSSLLIAQ